MYMSPAAEVNPTIERSMTSVGEAPLTHASVCMAACMSLRSLFDDCARMSSSEDWLECSDVAASGGGFSGAEAGRGTSLRRPMLSPRV